MSAPRPFDPGRTKKGCDSASSLGVSTCTAAKTSTLSSLPLSPLPKPSLKSVPLPTLECLPSIRSPILTDRSSSSTPNIQTLRSCKTSPRVSTSIAKGFSPFWNASSKALSAKLWSSTATGSVTSALSSSNGSFERLAQRSWFSARIYRANPTELVNSPMTCLPSQPSLWQRTTECIRRITESEEGKLLKKQQQALQRKKRTESPEKKEAKAKKREEKQAEKERKARESGKPLRKRKSPKKKADVPPVEKVKKPPAQRSRSALLELDPLQKQTLLRWFGTYRWTYNQCVATWEEKGDPSLDSLREKFVNGDSEVLKETPWVLHTPYNLRYEAVREFLVAYHNGVNRIFEEREKGNAEWNFVLKFRNKRKDAESMPLLLKYYKGGRPYGTLWSFINDTNDTKVKLAPLKSRKHDLPTEVAHDSKLIRKGKRVFLSVALPLPLPRTGVPVEGAKKKTRGSWLETQEPMSSSSSSSNGLLPPPTEKVVAIDPGVRTFATLYDPEGCVIEWAPKDIQKIQRLCLQMDKLHSRIDHDEQVLARKRRHLKKALVRMQNRIRNLVAEVHRKLVKFLCENYNVVLLPRFGVSSMVFKGKRRIGRKTVRQMLCWSHFMFRQRLMNKALEYPWVKIIECREDYTSKTCGMCGHINWSLGSSKTFKCWTCGYSTDRDLNGSRNILLRWLTESVAAGTETEPPARPHKRKQGSTNAQTKASGMSKSERGREEEGDYYIDAFDEDYIRRQKKR